MTGIEPGGIEALDELPENLRDGLRRYVEHGVKPGGFLCACIENDLLTASTSAHDDATLLALPTIMRWLYTFVFSGAWGSKTKREAWQRQQRRTA